MTAVRIASPADADEVGRVLADGFRDDPVLTWVFDVSERDEKLGDFFGFLASEALVPLGASYVLPGSCANWTPPGTPSWPDDRTDRFGTLLVGICTPAELQRLGALDRSMQEHHPSGDLWYLGSIATVVEAQGKGLGSALLQESLRRVDATALPAYLESSNPRNVPLYERHGFRATGTIELPGGPRLTTMWREPGGRGAAWPS
ncbi:MAG: GNAT family N-acetyltransferase [Acidimicrobiia bacterium]|nr:GNAT family N-acetyltransferase [Acidimicrobiia bacterium]